MSNCMHVHIKHEIEYGEYAFNWQMNGIKDLLNSVGCEVFGELNDDGIGDWEIEAEQLKSAIEKIKTLDNKTVLRYFDTDYVNGGDKDKFKEHVVEVLTLFVSKGDCHDGYYHFSWF